MRQKHPSESLEPLDWDQTPSQFLGRSGAPSADSRMQVWKGTDGRWRINWENEKHPCYADYATQYEAFLAALEIVDEDREIARGEVEACS
ncbi:hypothetical protein GCM10009569_06060 [Arthrobacter russicus]|uniref:DUF2188 domain-containing protein n=1 Tax=Arthrobacter russicus TaxID=172040 RepID=A0ABU1JGY6_9MICC|nr:hypothetical protein [Arthrobacter russicus]